MINQVTAFLQYLRDDTDVKIEIEDKEIKRQWNLFENNFIKTDDVESWIEDWVNLFPIGIKNRGNKIIKHPVQSVLPKMKSFIKQYKYPTDIIFEATKAYIREGEKNDFKFTRASIYFISKRYEGSDLAAWCERVKSGETLIEEFENDDYIEDEFI